MLREELPTLVAEIARDADEGCPGDAGGGGLRGRGARGGHDRRGRRPRPLGRREDQLRELLRLQLVGAEDISLEAGSNLATVTSIGALSTGARVLHQQGPRVLRGPTRCSGRARRWRGG